MAKIELRLTYSSVDIIDLEDFGHDDAKDWDDLTEDEQNDILDNYRHVIADFDVSEYCY